MSLAVENLSREAAERLEIQMGARRFRALLDHAQATGDATRHAQAKERWLGRVLPAAGVNIAGVAIAGAAMAGLGTVSCVIAAPLVLGGLAASVTTLGMSGLHALLEKRAKTTMAEVPPERLNAIHEEALAALRERPTLGAAMRSPPADQAESAPPRRAPRVR